MEEYLHYLNTVKSFQHGGNVPYESKRNYSSGRYSKDRDHGERFERDMTRKRRPMREYRDLDNPTENAAASSGRQLISYDDL